MTDAREQVIAGLEAAIRDPHCPLQYSPLLMQAQKLLRAIATPEPTEGQVERAVDLAMSWHPSERGLSYAERRREVMDLLAQALRAMPLQDDGWRDISTLPEEYKSGRKDFLVRFRSGHIDHVYLTVPEPPLAQTYRYCGGDMSGQQAGWPDHWMPRPEDPMVAEDGAKS